MSLIRDAIRTRYSFLPFWYTQFYETEKTGKNLCICLLLIHLDAVLKD